MSDDENEPTTVKLRANDSERDFEISFKAAKESGFIMNLLDATPNDGSTAIELQRVEEATLEKVVEFLIHHMEDPMIEIPTPLDGSTFDEIVTQEWYRRFMKELENPMVFDLLTAANYMQIKPLLELACLKVTFELTGKNAEEIRDILNLPMLTPEEEATARQEHRWIFESPGE
jgi:S-phase kinase-associated protein 1